MNVSGVPEGVKGLYLLVDRGTVGHLWTDGVKVAYLLADGGTVGLEKRSMPALWLFELPTDWALGDAEGVCSPISFKRWSCGREQQKGASAFAFPSFETNPVSQTSVCEKLKPRPDIVWSHICWQFGQRKGGCGGLAGL